MGATLGSIHLYQAEGSDVLTELRENYHAKDFSFGWISLFNYEWQEITELRAEARRMSKLIDAPVIAFYCYDDDLLALTLHRSGKIMAQCGHSAYDIELRNKKLPVFAEQLGIDDPGGKHLSAMLKCKDVYLLIDMLEEYLGVCLYADEDFFDEGDDDEEFRRTRGKEKFENYMREVANKK